MEPKEKLILDACCGGRMFWFNKHHPNVIYQDIRKESKGFMQDRLNFEVNSDIIQDFRAMVHGDKSFKLVVFDPPHIKLAHKNSWIAQKYGVLNSDTWKDDILKGFNECWRVLDDYGVLIFKWCTSSDYVKKRVITIRQILELLPVKPLFGHPSGSKMNTIWMCFMKIP